MKSSGLLADQGQTASRSQRKEKKTRGEKWRGGGGWGGGVWGGGVGGGGSRNKVEGNINRGEVGGMKRWGGKKKGEKNRIPPWRPTFVQMEELGGCKGGRKGMETAMGPVNLG